MNLFIDIETIPQQPEAEAKTEIAKNIQAPAQMSKAETIAAWHAGEGSYAGVKDALIEETYRKTSFDGAKGEIISIAFAVDDFILQFGKEVFYFFEGMLGVFHDFRFMQRINAKDKYRKKRCIFAISKEVCIFF